jgi:alpha-1,6-mannosyltransferase
MPMKVLDLGEFYSERGGGVRSYLSKMLPAAAARGHELVVVAPGPRDEELSEGGGRVVRYAAPRMPYDPTYHWPWRVDRMRAIIRRERPDVVQVSSPFVPAAVAASLGWRSEGPVPLRAYVYHSDPIGCYVEPFAARLPAPIGRATLDAAWSWMRAVCRSCDVTVVAGHWLRRLLLQKGCQNAKTVAFGIQHEDFGPERADPAVRRELMGPLADDPAARLLLITGRLAVDKRQALLVEAVQELARRRPVALCVLGDGPARATIEEKARGLPATFLSFTRDRGHYAAILASVDALLHGSRCETYGFVLAETLASGTPIVAPDAGGAGAMAVDGCAERYPPDADVREIASAIDRLLDRDREGLRAAALAMAAEQPSTQQHFDALFALYAEMLAERGRGVGAGVSV